MNLQETGTVLDVLETAYPRMFSGPGAVDRTKALGLWAKMFEDDRVDLVAAAVKSYIATDVKGFPPHIGAIKNAMHQLSSAGGLDAAQAWELLREAASRSGYGAREEYDRLPPEVREMTSPGQLFEYSQMDADVFASVIGSNFQKAYRVRQESRRRDALLPPEVKRVIAGVAARAALESGR